MINLRLNKKGIIFTIDALIALTIFIVIAVAVYSIITPEQTLNIRSSSMYINAENFLRASDKKDKFSDAFKQIQLGNDPGPEMLELLSELPYPAVLRLYVYENSELSLVLAVNEQNFENSIFVRKFLVLLPDEEFPTIQDMSGNITIHEISPNEPDASAPEHISINMTIHWYGNEVDQPELEINVLSSVVGDDSHISIAPYNEQTNPGFWTHCEPEFCIGEFSLTATVQPGAVVGASNIMAETSVTDLKTGIPYMYQSSTDFKTLRYGFIELEVETR